jgi:hypothetical protein
MTFPNIPKDILSVSKLYNFMLIPFRIIVAKLKRVQNAFFLLNLVGSMMIYVD